MADPEEEDAQPEVEREFHKTVALIGGREKIHLVSDRGQNKDADDDDAGILREFIGEMFPGCHANFTNSTRTDVHRGVGTGTSRDSPPDDSRPQTRLRQERTEPGARNVRARWTTSAHGSKRTIDSPVIIFIFRQTFVGRDANRACLEEILKDVKTRTKRASVPRPALVALVRAAEESDETRRCAQLLERLVRSVFHRHPPETVWVGSFIPRTHARTLGIKKNACKVICASQKADNAQDRGGSHFWPFQCLSWQRRRGPRFQDSNSPTNRNRDDRGSVEESIPLKIKPMTTGCLANGESAGGDS